MLSLIVPTNCLTEEYKLSYDLLHLYETFYSGAIYFFCSNSIRYRDGGAKDVHDFTAP